MIRRVIRRQGTPVSSWWINGEGATEQDVVKLTKSMNIQVSNLCQFLPQDKVPEFARMNQVELLRATQEAARSLDCGFCCDREAGR